MDKKTNKWIAAFLGLLISPLGLLYVGQPMYALLYLIFSLIMNVYGLFYATENVDIIITIISWSINILISVYAYKKAQNFNKLRSWYSKWYGQIGIIITFLLPVFIFRAFYFEPFHIPASSMAPNINSGDYIVVSKKGCGNYKLYGIQIHKSEKSDSCKIEKGDVIVFEYPNDKTVSYIKRVVAKSNDTISYYNKVLKVNGVLVENQLISEQDYDFLMQEKIGNSKYQIIHMKNRRVRDGEWVVPEKSYFVLGDNRDNSSDSRVWGIVPEENVLGVLYHVFSKSNE